MRILVVDDNKENLYFLQSLLEGSGYGVEIATNGAEALDTLCVKGIALIVSDILMPIMDGFQLCRKVKEDDQLKSIPFAFYTATYTDYKDEEFALRLGADQFIRKPMEPDEFLQIIRALVRDIEQGTVRPKEPAWSEEKEVFQLYSERLVNKLEKKMLDLEKEVTEHQLAEERQGELGRILEDSVNELYVFSRETLQCVMVNKGGRENLGYSDGELRHLSILDLIEEGAQGAFMEQLKLINTGGQSCTQCTSLYRRKDRSLYPVEMTLERTTFQSSSVIVVFVLDITERQKTDEALRQAEMQFRRAQKMEAMGILAGGIAHDFNNVLSAILGYSDLSMNLVQKESRVYRNLQEVLTAGRRAKELVRQILEFTRESEQGQRPIQLRPIIQETLALLRASLPTTIEVQQHYHTTTDTVLADPTQIHQVLMNLCTNAFHAMREKGGVLETRLENIEVIPEGTATQPCLTPGPYVRITVRDTGHGMSPEIRKQIFNPFFTTKEGLDGSGLGLAVVHSIITKYGGVIRVESAPEQGTIFQIDLPCLDVPVVVETPPEASIPKGSGRILFVDDEEVLAFLWKQVLEELGYRVEVRTSSLEALEAFRKSPAAVDVVITDQTMPHMTGEELAHELLQIRPNVPVILCTGSGHDIDSKKIQERGIRICLMKPFMVFDIATVLHQVLGQKLGERV